MTTKARQLPPTRGGTTLQRGWWTSQPDVDFLLEVDVMVGLGTSAPRVALGLVGSIATAHVSGGAMRIVRNQRHIVRDHLPMCHLVYLDRGRATFRQDGRIAEVEQGEFVLLDTTRRYEIDVPCPFESRVYAFPKGALGIADGRLERVTAMPLRQDHALSAFLIPMLARLTKHSAHLHPQTRAQLAQNVTDVVATLIGDRSRDASSASAGRDALMLRVKSFIIKNLGVPELSPALIAAQHNISVRYLHKLFDSEATSLTRWILAARLERCRVDLLQADGSRASRIPVSVVAHRWGFASAPRFSRVFRSAYGISPTEWRDAAQ